MVISNVVKCYYSLKNCKRRRHDSKKYGENRFERCFIPCDVINRVNWILH